MAGSTLAYRVLWAAREAPDGQARYRVEPDAAELFLAAAQAADQ